MRRWIILIGALFALVAATIPASLTLRAQADLSAYKPDQRTSAERGLLAFAYGDWGGLNAETLQTSALPWKLVEAALALDAADGNRDLAARLPVKDLFRPFGLHVPDQIANWPDTLPSPPEGTPLGLVRGQTVGFTPLSFEISNMGCATCHSAVTYDATGAPNADVVWLGGTNASLNLAAYTETLFSTLRAQGNDPTNIMAVVRSRFPETTWRERATLRYVVWPQLEQELQDRANRYGALLPFAPSHIGATNGYDSFRFHSGLYQVGDAPYFTSIPALGGRTLRNMFLANGVYGMDGIASTDESQAGPLSETKTRGMAAVISAFLIPSMGLSAEAALAQQDTARDVVQWLHDYTPQPFPGPINLSLAASGRDIYADHCASCHGIYDASLTLPRLQTFPNWQGDMGTDAGPPLDAVTELAALLNRSPFAPLIDARASGRRTAPPLTGLWASAPYLANGSVPTLWHLMRPSQRPNVFTIGGHHLDLTRVGIDLDPPPNHVPWSTPGLFDTSRPGFSNIGHNTPFDRLSDAEKDALLEYLKLL